MSQDSIAHTILNILEQCNSTTISIGQAEGHFISSKQLVVLRECAESLETFDTCSIDTPTSTIATASTPLEVQVKGRFQEVTSAIKRRQLEIANAKPADKSAINIELNKLWSERAKLDKLIKQFEALGK